MAGIHDQTSEPRRLGRAERDVVALLRGDDILLDVISERIADRFIRAFYLEKVSGNPSVLEIVERLADTDREEAPKLTFEETSDGWRLAA